MGLTASQNPYFTDSGNSLKVTWEEDDDPVEIWERNSANQPRFKVRDLKQSEITDREIIVTSKAGQVYTAALYDQRDTHHPDPNDDIADPPPESLLTVVGVVDQHRGMFNEHGGLTFSSGGTYISGLVQTIEKASVFMQVGTTAPVKIPSSVAAGGLMQILLPDASANSSPDLAHDLECLPLVPGQ